MSFAKTITLAAVAFLAACGSKHEPAPDAKAAAPIRVSTTIVEMRRLSNDRILSGTVTARTTGAVSARLPGHIREIRVREGEMVQLGQVIAIIDARDADAAIKEAEAAREEARAAIPEAQAAIAQATAQADLAKLTFQRIQVLKASNSITGQEFDEAQARLRLAESQLQIAQARHRQTQEKIRQASESLGRAQLQQTYATVIAPFAGLVLERKAEPGTFASPGMPILVLEKAGDYRLEVPVEESLLKDLKIGKTVGVEWQDTTLQLPVSEILPVLNAQSRTATIRINLPSSGLRSGMSGRIRLPSEDREAITVPLNAVRSNGQLQTVFVVENARARAVMVVTGEVHDGRLEIVSGLEGKERIITPPPSALTDGSPVEVAQ